MALFEFLTTLDSTNFMLLAIIFILFVVSAKKSMGIVINIVWAAGVSLLFPVVMNKFLGFAIPTDINTLMSFMILGVGAYFLYLVASSIYKALGIAEKAFARVPKPNVSLPKGGGDDRAERKLREREMKLAEREMKLKEKESKRNEKHANWMSRIEESKAPKRKVKEAAEEYLELKDEEPKKKNFSEPMKEIRHKKKSKEN